MLLIYPHRAAAPRAALNVSCRRARARARLALVVIGPALALVACKRPKEEPRPISINVTPAEAASAAHMELPTVKVLVTSAGMSITAMGGNVAPGCAGRGPGIAVPTKNGEHDFPELRRCLVKLKSAPELAAQRSIELVADKAIAYKTVIEAMDAARSTDDGGELFPDVVFGPAAH